MFKVSFSSTFSRTAFTMIVVIALTSIIAGEVIARPSGKIVVWGWQSAIGDVIVNTGILDEFKAEYPDVEVEIVYMASGDVYTQLPLALTAGTGTGDVVLVENSHLGGFVHMGEGAGLLDLTEKVQPYLEIMNDYKWLDYELNGKYYCLPWDSGPVVMYYRRDIFEAAGLPSEPEKVDELVATWDGYFDACNTIKEQTGAYCFSHNKANNNARLLEIALWEQGLGYYDIETGDLTISSEANVKTLEMLGRFWNADVTSDTQPWTDPWYAELGQAEEGKPVASIVEASWMEGLLKGWIAPGTAGKWGVTAMPGMPGGVRAANDGGSGFIIPAQTNNPEAAWAFVEFTLGRKESQVKMFAASGLIPSLETTYDDPVFKEGDPFLADQVARAIYVDKVKQIPRAGIYGPNYRMMNEVVMQAVQKYALGQMSAEQALKEAEEEIRANLD